jgi:putative ABC transport system permease protein
MKANESVLMKPGHLKRGIPFQVLLASPYLGQGGVIVNTDTKETNPDTRVIGGDENYLQLNGYELSVGRDFGEADVETGRSVCIIGNVIAQKLFGENPYRALDKIITVANNKYRVIGILKDKGSSAFMNADKVVITTYNNIPAYLRLREQVLQYCCHGK